MLNLKILDSLTPIFSHVLTQVADSPCPEHRTWCTLHLTAPAISGYAKNFVEAICDIRLLSLLEKLKGKKV